MTENFNEALAASERYRPNNVPLIGEPGAYVTKLVSATPADLDPEVAWSLLSANAAASEACIGDPLGYTETLANGQREIALYWGAENGIAPPPAEEA